MATAEKESVVKIRELAYEDLVKGDFIKNCLENFFSKNAKQLRSIFGSIWSFPVDSENICNLADYLYSEMLDNEKFFSYSCDKLFDTENKIIKIPYDDSSDIWRIMCALNDYSMYCRNCTDIKKERLNKLVDCFRTAYERVHTLEQKEEEKRRKEEAEKRDYQEYLRLKKKYEK